MAQAAEPEEEATAEIIHLQLKPFRLPLVGSNHEIAVTVFLLPVDQHNLYDICKYQAKLRDVVLVEGFKNPIAIADDGSLDLVGFATRLKPLFNTAVGGQVIDSVIAVPGEIGEDLTEPLTEPDIPMPRVCSRIEFREKRIK
ncbi:MAG: hypothetical protein ACPGO3_08965 [Magnetospiraceae bacterium]